MNVQLRSGVLTFEAFLDEMERYLQLMENIKNAQPGPDGLSLCYLAHDMASHQLAPLSGFSTAIARELGFTDESGRFTSNAVIFAKGILYLDEKKINPRLRDIPEAISNWTEVKPYFEALEAFSRGEKPPEPYAINEEVQRTIISYACGLPGAIKRMSLEAKSHRWMTAQDVRDWVGFPEAESTPERASVEIYDR